MRNLLTVSRRVFYLLSLATLSAYAQSSTAADLEGLITDSAGAVVPDARLLVTNVETGVQRHSATNQLGRYRVPELPAGKYELTISKAGFATVERKGLLLQIGQVATID